MSPARSMARISARSVTRSVMRTSRRLELAPLMLAALLAAAPPRPSIAQGPAGSGSAGRDAAGSAGIDDARPQVTVSLSPTELTVGDRITAVLTVTAPQSALAGTPRFPDWNGKWGTAEILEVDRLETLEPHGGLASFRQRMLLAAFRPGEVALPPQPIDVPLVSGRARLETPEDLAVRIAPVLPPPIEETGNEEELTPRPEEPPQTLPWTATFWWSAGLTAAGCALFAALLAVRVRPPRAEAEALTPLAWLEGDLDAVTAAPSLAEGHARLSSALRRYLGRQLAFPAAESTTTEIRATLSSSGIPEAIDTGAGEVLVACDLVKFACREATPGTLDRRIETARRVGRDLERHLHPSPPEPRP